MKSILAIDDDMCVLRLLDKFLNAVGYDVVVTNNGTAGVELFNNGHGFDLVITDISMPGMDGNEVAKNIRGSEKSNTPIIATTGSNEREIHRDLFDFVLIKPYRIESMVDTIRSHL